MSQIRNRVSIVIPAYNEERYLSACLDAIAAQSVKPFEVIVVDNNSTDQTRTIARAYPFVRVVKAQEQGIVFARNAGFDAARGDVIGRIDADTRLPRDWVAYVMQFYGEPEHATEALTGGCYFYNVRLPNMQGWFQGQIAFRWNRMLLGHYILFGSNMAIPRVMWKRVRSAVCAVTGIHEDLDLAIHVHRAGYKITYHEGLRVGVRMRGVLMSSQAHRENMLWWPNTLRRHGLWTWIFGWGGAMTLWLMTPLERFADRVVRLFGRSLS